MLIRAATWLLLAVVIAIPSAHRARAEPVAAAAATVQPTASTSTRPDTAPPDTPPDTPPASRPPNTINDFLPENRGIGECISALPKPDCGSESRGGWAQTAVFGAILAGIAFIVWRIFASARRAKKIQTGTPT